MTQIRMAQLEDAQAIAQMIRIAWAGKVAPDSSGHYETADKVRADLEKGYGWVVEQDGKIIATVRLVPHPSERGVGEIKKLGVLAEHRKQGWGPKLMEVLEEKAQALGLEELRLAVRHDQYRLVEWYGSLGYTLNPQLVYSAANPLTPPPFVLHKNLEVHP
ncbi:MAG TPA: GNAT family N-acetyltransferase [Meiothermus sp.]|jgi:N-acetylglutamate synthase-like GNAT family acetyltransferase|nr:GNAT family N-acetyltransferase [Meiothermus sp.]